MPIAMTLLSFLSGYSRLVRRGCSGLVSNGGGRYRSGSLSRRSEENLRRVHAVQQGRAPGRRLGFVGVWYFRYVVTAVELAQAGPG